jgi:very-short-patch-repair endonuclease
MDADKYLEMITASIDEAFKTLPHNPRCPVIHATDWCALCTRPFDHDAVQPGAFGYCVVGGYRFVDAQCRPCIDRFASASPTERERLGRIIEANLLTSAGAHFGEELVGTLDSPLEKKVVDYLVDAHRARILVDTEHRGLLFKFKGVPMCCIPQHKVETRDFLGAAKTFRIDFVFISRAAKGLKVAVEVDGHDFHERTKEQAQRDKSRDRLLTQAGYTVFRYTGSEIYRDTDRCVSEVLAYITSKEC